MKKIVLFIMGIMSYHQMIGQCLADRHNTTINAHWVSCQTAESPNELRGSSHWILYEFGLTQTIEGIKFWKVNHPNSLGWVISELSVDYSMDGLTWNELGTYQFELGSWSSTYKGEETIDLDAFAAKYVLITSLGNYGGNCHGLAEVKFLLKDQITSIDEVSEEFSILTYPNPFSDFMTVVVTDVPEGNAHYQLVDLLGRVVDRGSIPSRGKTIEFELEGKTFVTGQYFLKVNIGDRFLCRKISVIHPN